MEPLRAFLESSTIHGLTYISTTRKYAKLFWICVVVSGFTVAGFLIYQSFQAWAESPIKTTIDTLPIEDITFPKVTVCPPKNTYTNLNYDLMMAENITMTLNERNQLLEYTLELLHEPYYNEILRNMSIIQEENRSYNWYHGLSEIAFPYYYEDSYGGNNYMSYDIKTSAISGSVTSIKFGENYNPDFLERYLAGAIEIYVPSRRISNASLNFAIEKLSMSGLSSDPSTFSEDAYTIYDTNLLDENRVATRNITLDGKLSFSYYSGSSFRRRISDIDFENQNLVLNMMPGFKLNWNYNISLIPKQKYIENEYTKQFIR